MIEARKKPGMAFWATVVVVVVLLYPLSFGPAVWLAARGAMPETVVKWAYWPLLCQRVHLPNGLGAAIRWYGSLGIPSGKGASFTIEDLEGDAIVASFGSNAAPD